MYKRHPSCAFKWGYQIVCKIGSLSSAEGDIDIEITILYICFTLTLAFLHVQRISKAIITLHMTDKTTPNRHNRLKSEMTTLGPTCRLLGFIKMGNFSPC